MDDVEKLDNEFSRILTRFKKLYANLDFMADEIEKLNTDKDEETKGYVFSHRCCAEHIQAAVYEIENEK